MTLHTFKTWLTLPLLSLFWSLLWSVVLSGTPVLAQGLDVVGDSGKSVPAMPYYRAMVAEPSHPAVMDGTEFPLVTTLRSEVLKTPGVQVFKPQWLTTPIFIIGTDEVSRQWLAYNRRALIAMAALGIVVQADTPKAFKALQVVGEGLALVPASSDWLAQQLHAAKAGVYPLVVQMDGTAIQIVPDPESQNLNILGPEIVE